LVEKLTTPKTLFATYFQDKSTIETRVLALSVGIELAQQEPDPTATKNDLDAVEKGIKAFVTA
jgi:hypothetical protein